MQPCQDAQQTRKRNVTNQLTTPCKNKQKGQAFLSSQCLLTAQTMVKSQVEQLTELGHISTSMDSGRRSGHLDANDTTWPQVPDTKLPSHAKDFFGIHHHLGNSSSHRIRGSKRNLLNPRRNSKNSMDEGGGSHRIAPKRHLRVNEKPNKPVENPQKQSQK